MKILILTLLLSSCSIYDTRTGPNNHAYNLERCMEKFAKMGYDSKAVVKICGKAHERRP